MLLANLVFVASFLIAAFHAISAVPHIRERHIIRVPLKFKIIHHHKIKKIPIIIRKHVHYYKEKAPVIEDIHANNIFQHDDFRGHFDFPQEEKHQSDVSYGHDGDAHENDYDEHEQSQEDEYEDDDEYE